MIFLVSIISKIPDGPLVPSISFKSLIHLIRQTCTLRPYNLISTYCLNLTNGFLIRKGVTSSKPPLPQPSSTEEHRTTPIPSTEKRRLNPSPQDPPRLLIIKNSASSRQIFGGYGKNAYLWAVKPPTCGHGHFSPEYDNPS